MPKLIRFVIGNSSFGFMLGLAVAALLVLFNVNGLGAMFSASDSKFVVAIILGSSFGSTFAFAYLATALILLPTDKHEFDGI